MAEGSEIGVAARAGFVDERSIRILRLSVGLTLAAAVALGLGWPLSYLTPVLATSLLAARTPCPGLKQGAALVGVIAAAGVMGLVVVTPLTLYYPLICAAVIGLLLFLTFRAGLSGTSPFVVLFLLLAILLIPLIAQQSLMAAQEVTGGLLAGGGAALAVTWVAHALLPDPPGTAAPSTESPGSAPEASQIARRAVATTAVVYPVALLFYGFGLLSHLLILVFIAILAQQPSLTEGRRAGGAVIVANFGGGVAAMGFYELLVMAPSFGFFLSLVFLTTLLLGTRIFSNDRFASIYPTVLSTLLLLIGSSVAPFGDDVEAKFYVRIVQLGVAVVYVVGALALIEWLRSDAPPRPLKPEW